MIQIFCPSFQENEGLYRFTPISLPAALSMVESQGGPSALHWRHTYPAIRHLLRGAGMSLRANVDQGSTVKKTPAMAAGDAALWFRPVGRVDLQSRGLTAADFKIVRIDRLE